MSAPAPDDCDNIHITDMKLVQARVIALELEIKALSRCARQTFRITILALALTLAVSAVLAYLGGSP